MKSNTILERLEVLKSDQKDESIIRGVKELLQSKINTTVRQYTQKDKRAEIKVSLEKQCNQITVDKHLSVIARIKEQNENKADLDKNKSTLTKIK